MTVRITVYRKGATSTEALESTADAQAALAEEGTVLWADLVGRSAQSDELLREVFGFHPLAIEDVYKELHRPKVEDYDRYLYLILRGVSDGSRLDDVRTEELDLFLGSNFVVTHHSTPLPSIDHVVDQVSRSPDAMAKGPVFLAHALIDRLVDGFLPLADRLMIEVDRLEAATLAGEDELARIVVLKGSIHRLRRLAASQRDVVARLARAEFDEIPDEARPFFRDVHEHLAQLAETLEHERDELDSVFDAFHSLSAHRMNEIMKVLTLISTIMLPLTFLTGVYGMNFKNMPEREWEFGYPALWGVMLTLSLFMVLFFRRRRWL
ncbi:MAG: magnesium/cobalt transporter CorA [Planctomycetes bacterium]|nr:magnesium/cobalt transporter CorA [Planctomycetota bacterium]